MSLAFSANVNVPTSFEDGVPEKVRVALSNDIHEGVLFDIEYNIEGVSYEKVEGEKVNEKGSETTASGGTWSFMGKDSRGMAWTSDNDPKRTEEIFKEKVMIFISGLQSANNSPSRVPLQGNGRKNRKSS